MGINLQWEGERGDVRDCVLDERGLMKILVIAAKEDSICLRFVDPYGNTVFNQMQIPVFLKEVNEIDANVLSQEVIEYRDEITELVLRAVGKVHTYLKFYGD